MKFLPHWNLTKLSKILVTQTNKEIKKIIHHCRDMSETQLLTIRDLLRFMLTIKSSHAPLQLNDDADKINELELKYERKRGTGRWVRWVGG